MLSVFIYSIYFSSPIEFCSDCKVKITKSCKIERNNKILN